MMKFQSLARKCGRGVSNVNVSAEKSLWTPVEMHKTWGLQVCISSQLSVGLMWRSLDSTQSGKAIRCTNLNLHLKLM